MDNNFVESIDQFKVTFGGEKHSIDAELFTKTINNTIDLIKSSANIVDPNCFLRLEIKANKEGSFETIIDTVARHAVDLITKENAKLASQIVVGLWALLQIKTHLGGKRAKEIKKENEETKIVNQENAIITVDSKFADGFFQNTNIDNSIINIFSDLKKGEKESFSIEHNEKKISFSMGEYDNMKEKVVDEKNNTSKLEQQKPIEVNLLLKKPDLLGDSLWQFVYNKNISAKIEDKDFLNKVHRGDIKKLYAGVKIPCLLQIEYELDEFFNPIPNSDKYTVKEVTGDIIEPPTHANLFDKKND